MTYCLMCRAKITKCVLGSFARVVGTHNHDWGQMPAYLKDKYQAASWREGSSSRLL